jgi:hypothetical protein
MQSCIDITATQVSQNGHGSSPLGPMAGAWDGYIEMEPAGAMRAKALVGHIHAQTESCARAAIDIGKRLTDLKDLLPHGQFMACVKAEFGWSQQWAHQLMAISGRFSNHNSSSDLPSSAKVLALLASNGADDATVQQAADEHWTVAETKQRLRKSSAPRQPQPAEAMALSILRKGELNRIREALQLAESALAVTAFEVMEEQRLRELGKLRFIPGAAADFHRMKDGSWIRLPHAGDVDVTAEPAAPVAHEAQQSLLVMDSPKPAAADVVSLGEAAKRIGVKRLTLTAQLAPSRNPNGITRGGFLITRESWGMVRLAPVAEPA